eukprot:PhF_6_TR11594/c0_g1_i1/m.18771
MSTTKVSKYRHAKFSAVKKEQCMLDAKPSTTVWDLSNSVAANSSVLALPWASTGGSRVTILKHTDLGKLPSKVPQLLGHTSPVIDLAFNPFVESILATGSEDSTIRIWNVPPTGLTGDVSDSLLTLSGHGKKVGILQYHPSAANVLASASMDNTVKVWDLEKGLDRLTCALHGDQILSLNFNLDGSLVNTTCKDKKIRVIDLRSNTCVGEAISHEGLKAQRSVWAKRSNMIISVGFNKDQYRQMMVWDPRNITAGPAFVEDLDRLGGIMMPLVEEDTGMLYLAGKGDTTIKVFEVTSSFEEKPPIIFASDQPGQDTQKGLCFLPKTTVNPRNCELSKMIRVTGNTIQYLSMSMPRKLAATEFQVDVYPPTFSSEPALTASEYFGGGNAVPKTVSLQPLFDGVAMPTTSSGTFTAPTKNPLVDAVNNGKARVEKLRAELKAAEAELAKACESAGVAPASPTKHVDPTTAPAPAPAPPTGPAPPKAAPPMKGPPTKGAPPPPPPPPPPPMVFDDIPTGVPAPSTGGVNALFAEIQAKGNNITAGLKKVTDDQKLYKQKREIQPVNFDDLEKKKAQIESKETESRAAAKVNPKFELQGNRYIIQDQIGTSENPVRLSITETKMSYAIQVSRCSNFVLEIKGKVNCVNAVECKKVFLSLIDVVSTVQVTATTGAQVFVNGFVPCITVERSADVDLHLKSVERCRDIEIVSATSSAVNVIFPNEKDAEDLLERPVPEQYVTKVVMGPKGYKLVTGQSAHC